MGENAKRWDEKGFCWLVGELLIVRYKISLFPNASTMQLMILTLLKKTGQILILHAAPPSFFYQVKHTFSLNGVLANKETVDHSSFRCGWWSMLREAREIKSLAKRRWGDTAFVSGGWSGERKDGAPHSWKPDLKIVNTTIKFVEATERLNNNRWRRRE